MNLQEAIQEADVEIPTSYEFDRGVECVLMTVEAVQLLRDAAVGNLAAIEYLRNRSHSNGVVPKALGLLGAEGYTP